MSKSLPRPADQGHKMPAMTVVRHPGHNGTPKPLNPNPHNVPVVRDQSTPPRNDTYKGM